MFPIKLMRTTKQRNSIKVSGVIIGTTQVLLKDNTSVIHPVFELDLNYNGMVTADEIVKANYLQCDKFNRYYWINDITFESEDLVTISCTVDALVSFHEGILASRAYINYASSKYNALIPDRRIQSMINHYKTGEKKQKITGLSSGGSFVLYTASSKSTGNTGLAQGYLVSQGTLASIANKFLAPSFLDKIADKLYSPLDAIFTCMWLPCNPSFITAGASEITFGEYTAGSYPTVKSKASSETTIAPVFPFRDDITQKIDWRNIAPYTTWYIWLPGVGYQEFPMELCLKDGSSVVNIKIKLQLSPTNGSCTYTITANGVIVMLCKGNIGVNLPVAKSNNGLDAVVSQGAGLISSAGFAATAFTPVSAGIYASTAASTAASMALSMAKHSVSANGAIGGFSTPKELVDQVALYYVSRELSDNPFGSLKNLIGCPVFKDSAISDYVGSKIFCGNVNFKWSDFCPTLEEYNMILSSLTSNDGVWIEE